MDWNNKQQDVRLFNALSTVKRLTAFEYFLDRCSVPQIVEKMGIKKSTLQNYTKPFKKANLIKSKPTGGYEVTDKGETVRRVIDIIDDLHEIEDKQKAISTLKNLEEQGVSLDTVSEMLENRDELEHEIEELKTKKKELEKDLSEIEEKVGRETMKKT